MDIATLTNAPRDVTLQGKTYKVSALRLKEWGCLQSWLKDHSPSPVARVRSADIAGLDEADRRTFLREAFLETMNWPPRVGSQEWMRAIDDAPGGPVEFLMVVLGRHQPMARADAEVLAETLSGTDYAILLLYAFGQEPPDPKGGSRTATATDPTSPTGPTATNGAGSSTAFAGSAKDSPIMPLPR